MTDKMSELVYAIERKRLEENNVIQNCFRKITPEQIESAFSLLSDFHIVMARRDCENDPTFKHIIPYTIITSELNDIFVVRRTEKQSEKRLHGKASIGIGGHIGPTDRMLGFRQEVQKGMIRELQEEVTGMELVGESFEFAPQLIGFVNDDSNDVGKVHFGLVYELLVGPDRMHSIRVKETENMIGEWMSLDEAKNVENYESWSEFIIRGL